MPRSFIAIVLALAVLPALWASPAVAAGVGTAASAKGAAKDAGAAPPATSTPAPVTPVPATPVPATVSPDADAALREAWRHLEEHRPAEAHRLLEKVDSTALDLGDYVVFLLARCRIEEKDLAGAGELHERLRLGWPDSPLLVLLAHELSVEAATSGDLKAARRWSAISRGKVSGAAPKAEEAFVTARLLESDSPRKAFDAHLANLMSAPATDGGSLSMERLLEWRTQGMYSKWKLTLATYADLARALAKAGETARSNAVSLEALTRFPAGEEYWTFLLEYAEGLRRQNALTRARQVLDQFGKGLPGAFKPDRDLLLARIDWRAGRLKDARARFLEISTRGTRPGTSELARYLAATMAERDGDLATATAEFGKLRDAVDDDIRLECRFRHPFGLYLQKRYEEAVTAFEEALRATGLQSAERARDLYWKGRSLRAAGHEERAVASLEAVLVEGAPSAHTLLALAALGRDPFAVIDPAPGDAAPAPTMDREGLWDKIESAGWSPREKLLVRRVRRLESLGMVEFAVMESLLLDDAVLGKSLGLASGANAALFRYLAGDLRNGIRESFKLPRSSAPGNLADQLLYPLADCTWGMDSTGCSGLDPLLVHSVIRQESLFQVNALSRVGAVGLMQLMPATAAEVARGLGMKGYRRADLLKPAVNIRMGSWYLKRLVTRYGGDRFRAVAAYNAGERAVDGWWTDAGGEQAVFVEKIAYAETRGYVRKVFANLLTYNRIYRPEVYARLLAPIEAAGQSAEAAQPAANKVQ